MKYATTVGDKTYTIEINDDHHLVIDSGEGQPPRTYTFDLGSASGQTLYSLLIDNQSFEAFVNAVEDSADEVQVLLRGHLYDVKVVDERAARLAKSAGGAAAVTGDFNLKAPMPGIVVAVPVNEGQEIKKGDILVILESMKMQNELKSPRDGRVARVKTKPGDNVEQNQALVTVAA